MATSNSVDVKKDKGTEGRKDTGGHPFSSNLSLEEISVLCTQHDFFRRKMQAKFAAERDWEKYHTPRNLLLAMVGEVGELSELFQWRGEVKTGLPGWSEEDREHLGQEISDVLIYLVRLAECCHVDMPAVVLKKFELNAKKYPIDKVHGSSLKYTAYVDQSPDKDCPEQ